MAFMPIPGNVVRVTLQWSLRAAWPNEIALNTFHVQPQSGPGGTVPNPQYIADQIESKLEAHWSDVSSLFPSGQQIVAIKTYLLDTAGHTIAEGVNAPVSGTLPGTGTSGSLPPEVAICLSEWAYQPGGFAPQKGRKRGRMYLGPIAQGLCNTDGRVNLGLVDTPLSGWQAIFNAINTINATSGGTDPIGVVILSRTGNATYEVLHLSIDDHFDAQRRRQHQDVPVRRVVDITAW